MAARQKLIDTIRGVYENYGFSPLGTPAIEHLQVLTGKSAGAGQSADEATQSLFEVVNPEWTTAEIANKKHDYLNRIALRFDLTVPLARVVAQYRDLPRPFRRYQVASVWRADKPDKGRYREFTQFDIDSVGVDSELADVEIMAAMCDTMTALEAGPYRIRFSSRKILQLLLDFAGIPAQWVPPPPPTGAPLGTCVSSDVFRVLDKLDKIGPDLVRRELTTGYTDKSGAFIPGLGLENSQVDRINQFLAIKSAARATVITELRSLFAPLGDRATAEIDAVARLSDRLGSLGYGDDRVSLDLSIARGLAYYTGTVFETNLLDAPEYGSVFSGGRYDDLVTRFLPEKVPAVGASVGVDRLLAAMIDLKRVRLRNSTAQVLVTAMDERYHDQYLKMAFELRRAGVRTELYLACKAIGKQLKHADALGVPLAVVCGGNEMKKSVVQIKEMAAGKQIAADLVPAGQSREEWEKKRKEWLAQRAGQIEVPRAELVANVKRILSELGEA